MKELIKKNWDYTLYDNQNTMLLKVLCGTVAAYNITIELNPLEIEYYKNRGEDFINELARKTQSTPSLYTHRNMRD